MTAEERKARVRRYFDEIVKEHLEVVDEVLAPDYVLHDPTVPEFHGLEEFKKFHGECMKAFSDAHLEIEDQVAEGDEVVTRWKTRSKHTGEFMGIAPTNKEIEVTGITISRFAGDKIAEEWQDWDSLGLMKELGVCEAPL
jgi:predicted ester cyclase